MAVRTFYRFRLRSAYWLFAILAFALLAFGAVDTWAWTAVGASVLGLGAAWAVRRLIGPFPFVWSWFYLPLGLIVAVTAAQAAFGWTADAYATAGALAMWLTFTVWFVLLVNVLEDTAIRRTFSRALPWLAFVVAVLAIVQNYTAPLRAYWFRAAPGAAVFGPFADRNHFAVLVELLFPLALYLALQEDRGRKKLLYFVLCGVMIVSTLIAASYVGFVILVGEFLVVLAAQVVLAARSGSRRRRARLLLSVAVMAVVAVILVATADSNLFDSNARTVRRLTRERVIEGDLAGDRLVAGLSRSVVAEATWGMFLDKPLTGHGAGAFGAAFPAYMPFQDGLYWNHAQNDPLELAAELGVTGPAAQVLILLLAVGRRRSARVWLTAILPLAAAWAHSLTEFPLQTPALALTALAVLALIPSDSGFAVRSGHGRSAHNTSRAGTPAAKKAA